MLEQKPQNMCSHRLESQSASEITVSAYMTTKKLASQDINSSTPADKQSDQVTKRIFHLNNSLGLMIVSIHSCKWATVPNMFFLLLTSIFFNFINFISIGNLINCENWALHTNKKMYAINIM